MTCLFRWFHDGCCECVGHQCINYGINQSRCSDCPLLEEEEDLTDDEMDVLVNMSDYDGGPDDDSTDNNNNNNDKSKN